MSRQEASIPDEAKRPIRVGVAGVGRMGREVIGAVAADAGFELAGVWSRREGALADKSATGAAVIGSDLDAVVEAADVTVDFTLPAATIEVMDAVVRAGKPLVCGVSGLDAGIMQHMRSASSSVPILYDRNMSLGIAVLTDLARRAGAVLGPEFVVAIHEAHHVHKVDAPSGTALKLGEALAEARGRDFASVYRYAADRPAERNSAEDIVFTVTREGENPGEHTVTFRSGAETLQFAHKVTERRVFALGALQAARWLVRQKPGFYQMRDIARVSTAR